MTRNSLQGCKVTKRIGAHSVIDHFMRQTFSAII